MDMENDMGEDMDMDMDMEMKKGGKKGMMHMDSPFEMMMKAETLMKWQSINPTMGNVVYLLVAAAFVTEASLHMFRYTKKTGFWTQFHADSSTTDWFKIGDQIQYYGNLSLYGAAFLTSLLALFGIAPMINVMVWYLGVYWVGAFVLGISFFFKLLAFDSAHKNLTDLKYGATAAVAYGTIKGDFAMTLAGTAMKILPLVMQSENWRWAMFDAQSDEEQEAYLEEIYMDIEEWEKEQMMEMKKEKKAAKGEKGEKGEKGAKSNGDKPAKSEDGEKPKKGGKDGKPKAE